MYREDPSISRSDARLVSERRSDSATKPASDRWSNADAAPAGLDLRHRVYGHLKRVRKVLFRSRSEIAT